MNRSNGQIEKVLAVHDVGRAVNPMLCEGQIQGAVHMGLGYALSEDFPSDEEGRPQHMTLRSLGILRPKDVPKDRARARRRAPTTLSLRHQRHGRDRSRPDRRRGSKRPPRP